MNTKSILCAGLLVCALNPWVAFAAEDPARFLAATEWQGVLTRSANDSGSSQYTDSGFVCNQTWTLSHSSTLNVTMPLDGTAQGPSRIYLAHVDATPFSTLNESRFETCTDGSIVRTGSFGAQVSTQFPTPGSVSILIDTIEETYTIDFNLPILYQMIYDGVPVAQYLQVNWFWNDAGPDSGLHITRPLPAAGTRINGTASIGLPNGALHGCASIATASAWPDFTSNLVITWDLSPKTNDVELEVELKDAATGTNYDHWLPAGNFKMPEQPGNSLKFIARLLKPDGTPSTDTATSFKCELMGVSQQPGVCMNLPISGGAGPDFKLLQLSNFPPHASTFWLVESESSMMTALPGLSSAEGIVCCYDFGAYATIKVTAMVNGQELVGYRKADPDKEKAPIRLPKRKSFSFVADKWKDSVDAGNSADGDDPDDQPAGDGHDGDGLSLYEEYRGFSINRQHVRTDPRKKDFFVCDLMGDLHSAAGLRLLGAQSGLKVRKVRKDEMRDTASLPPNTMINFNHAGDSFHLVDQHGIVISRQKKPVGFSYAGPDPANTKVGTPGVCRTVFIDPREFGWTTARFGAGRIITRDGGAPEVAHELGHTCAVYHHGDTDPKVVIWARTNNLVFEGVVGGNASLITLLQENGAPFIPDETCTEAACYGMHYVGAERGEHSGNENCFMRYHFADSYKHNAMPSIRYYPISERTGAALCTSAAGTGVNAERSPLPIRYGDAAANRGNCKAQVCVNDLRAGDSIHMR